MEAKVGVPDTTVAHPQPVAGQPLPPGAHGSGRERWRGGGVYLDGAPLAMLRFAELPVGLSPIWETQRRRLPFKAGEEIRYEETQVRRYRMTDYLRALGVSIKDITELHILGTRDTAIVLTRAKLIAHEKDILFKFSSETSGKPIPILRDVDVGTSFDDIRAVTIYMKRTPPKLTPEQTLELDGRPVKGIAYHGEPMREGVRVYLDDRLVTTLKRNQLATEERWQLADVLAKSGVPTERIKSAELIHEDARTAAGALGQLQFAFNAGHSGEILVGEDAKPANAVALFTKPAGRPVH